MSQTKAELVNGLSVNAALADAATIDSSGNVGIGTTSPSSFDNSADDLVISTSGNTGITINSGSAGSTSEGNLVFAEGTAGSADKFRGAIQYKHGEDRFSFYTNASERMRIDLSGFVGIGESSPSSYDSGARTLVISQGGTLAGMTIRASQQGAIYFADGTSSNESYRGRIEYIHADDALRFGTAATERMRIDSSGGLFLGVTSAPTASSGGICFRNNDEGRKELLMGTTTTSTRALVEFINGNGSVGSISVSGSNTSYNTSSDYRLKENVTAISDGITRLKTLKPSRFNFKADSNTTVDGFLAHEVTAVPEAITGTKDEVATEDSVSHKKDDPIYQSIDQSKLVPLLTAALQEEISKREALETRVATLEAA